MRIRLRPLAALYLAVAMLLIGTAPPAAAEIGDDPWSGVSIPMEGRSGCAI